MPQDYRELVFDVYKKRKTEMDLSSNLLNPTPGNLRSECLIVHREKYTPKDHEVLRLFFSDGDKEKGYLRSIENSPAEKFKQMSKILKGVEVKNPGVKYFELLEWLMGLNIGTSTTYYRSFYIQPQSNEEEPISIGEDKKNGVSGVPLEYGQNVVGEEKENRESENQDVKKSTFLSQKEDVISGEVPMGDEDKAMKMPQPLVSPPNNELPPSIRLSYLDRLISWLEAGPNSGKKKLVAALIPVTLIALGSYTFFEHISSQCMYWSGDHYETVGCKLKIDHATVIALNEQKVNRLKRITRIDTLGEKDLGKVWYVKIRVDSAEFYTDSGAYPLDARKRLLPITPYILNKYILKKDAIN